MILIPFFYFLLGSVMLWCTLSNTNTCNNVTTIQLIWTQLFNMCCFASKYVLIKPILASSFAS